MILKGVAGVLGVCTLFAMRSDRNGSLPEVGIVLDATRPGGNDFLALLPDGQEKS